MTLNASGPISLGGSTAGQSVSLELGQSATIQSSINATDRRTLAGVPSGQISLSNFYGKSNIALRTNMTGYYEFEEALSNSNLTDSHTTARTLTYQTGSIPSTTGIVGNARSFNTSTGCYFRRTSTNVSVFFSTTSYTMCGWIKFDGTTTLTGASLVQSTGTAPAGFSVLLTTAYNNGTGLGSVTFNKYATVSSGTQSTISSGSLSLGTSWHFFVAWVDSTAGTQNIQIDNGTVQSTSPGTIGTYNNAADAPLFQLASNTSGNASGFILDQFGFWNRALSATERAALWNSGAGLSYAGTA